MKKIIIFAVAALLICGGLYFSYTYFFKAPHPVEVAMTTQTLQNTSKNFFLDGPSASAKTIEKSVVNWQEFLTPIFSLLSLIGGFILIVVQIILNIKEIENLPDDHPKKQ